MRWRGGWFWTAAILAAAVAPAPAAITFSEIHRSSDVSRTEDSLSAGDEDVTVESGGGVLLANLGGLPLEADVDAYLVLPQGEILFSLDTTVLLPGGLLAHPGDVVLFDGAGYGLHFSAADLGIDEAANLDAVALSTDGSLLVSFDVAVSYGGVVIQDEDLASLGAGGRVDFAIDGSSIGVPDGLDLDAATVVTCNGHVLVSFDGSGQIGGLDFDDEDVLEVDPATGSLELVLDGSEGDPQWGAADLDALDAVIGESAPGEAGGLGISIGGGGTRLTWSSLDPSAGAATTYDIVGGSLGDLQASGGFTQAACVGAGHPDTPFVAGLPDPMPGEGFYYLLRAVNACAVGTFGDAGTNPDPRDLLDTAAPCP